MAEWAPGCIFPMPWNQADQKVIDRTVAQLAWSYGADRAAEIAQGEDARANLDIAKWRFLGALATRSRKQKEDRQ